MDKDKNKWNTGFNDNKKVGGLDGQIVNLQSFIFKFIMVGWLMRKWPVISYQKSAVAFSSSQFVNS